MSANPSRRWTNHIRPWAPTAATFAPPLVIWERHRETGRGGGGEGEKRRRRDGEKRRGEETGRRDGERGRGGS